jgi:hypothetical protein
MKTRARKCTIVLFHTAEARSIGCIFACVHFVHRCVVRYVPFGLCIAALLLHAQISVRLPNTSLVRGTSVQLPVSIGIAVQRGDTITLTLRYPRSALNIEDVTAKFPSLVVAQIISDQPLGQEGLLTIGARATGALDTVALWVRCSVLWSGSSPAKLDATRLTRNGQLLATSAQGGVLRFEPADGLPISDALAFGPIFPNPVSGDRISATVWLDQESSLELTLYDPLGREHTVLRMPTVPAGPHTIELPIDRLTTSAGVYHLRLRTNARIFIAPCVIGK